MHYGAKAVSAVLKYIDGSESEMQFTFPKFDVAGNRDHLYLHWKKYIRVCKQFFGLTLRILSI